MKEMSKICQNLYDYRVATVTCTVSTKMKENKICEQSSKMCDLLRESQQSNDTDLE